MKIDKLFFKEIIKFAIPVFFDQGFVALLLTMNTIMCSGSGTAAVSAIGMVDSVHMLVAQFFIALAAGGTVVVAQCMGRDDRAEAAKAAKQGLFTGVVLACAVSLIIFLFRTPLLSLLFGKVSQDVMREANNYFYFSIFAYPFQFFNYQGFGVLRASGNSKTPMLINLSSTVVNLLMGLFLIMGIKTQNGIVGGFGPLGAGITFLVSRIVGCVLVFIAINSVNSPVRINFLEKFKFDIKIIKSIYNIGIPASTESLLFMLGRLICQVFISTMGTSSIAINSIANSLATIHSIPGNSMGIVATTLVGRQVGAKSEEGAKKTLLYCNIISYIFVLVFLIPFVVFSNQLAGIYSNVPEIIKGTGFLIRTYAVASLFWPVAFVMPSGFRGASDAVYPLVTAIGTMWLLRVLLGFYLGVVMGMGVLGIWIGMYSDWIVRTFIYTRRYIKETWLKKMRAKTQEK